MNSLQGKTAIVTGGARGMGEATARLFAEAGARVIIADLLDELGEAVAADIGETAEYLHMDITSETDWQNAITLANRDGNYCVLVNNAAVIAAQSIAEQDAAAYMKIIEVNQLGTYNGIRASIETMKLNGGGSIVNISSVDGMQSKNGLSAYSSSKWAVRGLSKCAAIELGPYNIRVNSVHPGGIFTPMHSVGGDHEGRASDSNGKPSEADNAFYVNHAIPRVGLAEEVAKMSLFLASDDASYSTGAEFLVDGGWHAGMRLDLLPSS